MSITTELDFPIFGGAENVCQKMKKALLADATKCAKITDLCSLQGVMWRRGRNIKVKQARSGCFVMLTCYLL